MYKDPEYTVVFGGKLYGANQIPSTTYEVSIVMDSQGNTLEKPFKVAVSELERVYSFAGLSEYDIELEGRNLAT